MLRKLKNNYVLVLLVLLFLAAGYFAYHFYNRYQDFYKQFQDLKNNPSALSKEETQALVDSVGKLVEIPKDETPTVATVLDKEKLKDQSFFQTAENGDKVLIFVNAKKAILYRPSTNKIVEIAPVFSDTTGATSTKK